MATEAHASDAGRGDNQNSPGQDERQDLFEADHHCSNLRRPVGTGAIRDYVRKVRAIRPRKTKWIRGYRSIGNGCCD